MKHNIKKWLKGWMLVLLVIGIVSCGKDSGTNPEEESPGMSAKVDGKSWTAAATNATYISNVLVITGSAQDGSNITLSLMNVNGPGSFDIIGPDPANMNTATYTVNFTPYTATKEKDGICKIEKLTDSEVKGTFSFKATSDNNASDVIEITEGKFLIQFKK
ncbi:MAG: hypothetical protein GXO78_04150 [Calditrichaeota bacterium]|nr:hypothetical protein [Calditrichota bacterium]